MSHTLQYGRYGALTQDQTRTLFSQTMGFVALAAGMFAVGAYAGRGLSDGLGFVWFIAAFVCLIAINFTMFDFQRLCRSGDLASAPAAPLPGSPARRA
jgi:hypothetical protein